MTFPIGSGAGSRQCSNVQILDDTILENNELFLLSASLNSPIPSGVSVGRSSATVTILDNDRKYINNLHGSNNM